MRFFVRCVFVFLLVTLFCCVVWLLHEIKSQDNDPVHYSAYSTAAYSIANLSTSDTTDDGGSVVARIQPWEASQLIRDLGFDTQLDFEAFNNETGSPELIVPNVIHYIRFKQARFSFVEYICTLSAYLQQQPDYIFIHTDVVDGFRGKYWRWITRERDLASKIRLLPMEAPNEIFGKKLSSSWRLPHGSDFERIRTIMTYGGIYLDNDVYVVQNLDKYRHYELAIGWPIDSPIGNQVIIGHRSARFPPLWLDTYHEYHADNWYYNAGERPVKEVLEKRPEIVHRVAHNFGVHQDLLHFLYSTDDCTWPVWRQMETVHLLTNHRWYLDPYFDHYRSFNERNVVHYPFSFGEMARLVLAQIASVKQPDRLCLPPK